METSMSFPIEHGDIPVSYVGLPEGKQWHSSGVD